MKAEYKDKEGSPGRGYFSFSGSLFPSPPWSVSLRRSSDQNFLAPGGKWAGESVFIPLEGKDSGEALELELGPEIVESLSPQDQYKITLRGGDGEDLTARLKIGSITFSRGAERDNTARVLQREEAGRAAGQELPPREEKTETPPPPPPPAPEEELRMEGAPGPEGKSRSKPWLAIALAALVITGGLAFLLWKFLGDKTPEALPESPPAQESAKSVEDSVKEFFAGPSPEPRAALNLAQTLKITGPKDQDAIYRLYYFAAENNDPEACIPYGNCLNPALPQWGTIKKSAPDAMKAYERAAELNPDAARKAQEELMAWLRQKAGDGDRRAAEWLQEIEK